MTTRAAEQLLPPKLSRRWHYAREQAISFLMQQAVENPDVISLAAGLVDSETLPVEETRAAVEKVLADHGSGKMALQYGTTAGSERLRRLLLAHFAGLEGCDPHDLGVTASQFVVTTGSQQLLSLVCEILLDPGDICLVAARPISCSSATSTGSVPKRSRFPATTTACRLTLSRRHCSRSRMKDDSTALS